MDPLTTAQYQIRNNAEELQDFLRDLNQWKEEMTKKEKEVGTITSTEERLPPIRGSKSGKSKIDVVSKNRKNKEKEKAIAKEEAKAKRISSYDYNAWDKFDADKACEEVDKAEEEKESEEEDLSEVEDFETVRRREEAAEEKEKGNDFFRLGKIDQAIECYTRGILCDPSNPFLPANRALALLKKEMFSAAEQDCNLALEIDKNYVKAIQRRGIARVALKKIDLAKEDFLRVLQLEPGNKQAHAELLKLKQLETSKIEEKKEEKQEKREEKDDRPRREVKFEPSCEEKDEAKREEKHELKREEIRRMSAEESKGKRIQIEEINSESTNVKNNVMKPINKPPHLRSKKPLKRMKIIEISPKPRKEIPPEDPKSVETKEMKPKEVNLKLPPCPETHYQFQRSWKTLKDSTEMKYFYLIQIPYEKFSTLFEHVENDVISDILNIMNQCYVRDQVDVYTPLNYLSEIKRFPILSMFFSSEDKEVLRHLFKYIENCNSCSKEELEKLANCYQVQL